MKVIVIKKNYAAHVEEPFYAKGAEKLSKKVNHINF